MKKIIVNPGSAGLNGSPPEIIETERLLKLDEPIRIIAETSSDVDQETGGLRVAITELLFDEEGFGLTARIVQDLSRPLKGEITERLRDEDGSWNPFVSERIQGQISRAISRAIMGGKL